jgi:hypothetical protein
MAQFELCDSPEGLMKAVNVLESCSIIAFDCEGLDLGAEGGKMSLLSCKPLGTESSKSYLIDGLAFTIEQLRPLLSILSNEAIHKVVWDGRMDYSELWHGYAIELKGTLDLQIADIVGRQVRGEGVNEQMERLCSGRFIAPSHVRRNKNNYAAVHRISGLKGAAEDFGFLPKRERKPREQPKKDSDQKSVENTQEGAKVNPEIPNATEHSAQSITPNNVSVKTEAPSAPLDVQTSEKVTESKPEVPTAPAIPSISSIPDATAIPVPNPPATENLRVDVDHAAWMTRPLTEQQLRYAVADVDLITLLYQLFKEKGWIDVPVLARQSHVYVSMYKEARPDNANIYSRHALMPLDVLDVAEERPDEFFYKCLCCGRRLREKCFQEGQLDIGGTHRCCVCEAIYRYVGMRKRQGRDP